MTKKEHQKKNATRPVIKLRHFLFGLAVVAALTSAPFLMVWKQVFIRTQSIRRSSLADSLAVRRSEIARLRLMAGRLSATERIERLGRENLGLEYPAYDRITLVKQETEQTATILDNWQFFAILKKSFNRNRG